MDGVHNGADTMACPHCGKEMRRGMIRCRECGKAIAETGEDFVLTGHELLPDQDRRCVRCGTVLEEGVTDCPTCTSAMLDELMTGSGAEIPQVPATRPGRPASPPPQPRQPVSLTGDDDPFAEPEAPVETALRPRPAPAGPHTGKSSTPARPSAPGKTSGTRSVRTKPVAPPAPAVPSEAESLEQPDDPASTNTPVETTAACSALLASLSTADAVLRCEIAAALGKLGDKAALGPLDRFMADPDIRVRRAVAAALVQLGHPKGETLLDIAERKPAAAALVKPPPAKAKKPGGGSTNVDSGMLLKVGGGLVAVAAIVGGIWWAMSGSSGGSRPKKKAGKPPAAKSAKPSTSKPRRSLE
jgi:hypothetical protein